MSSNEPWEEEVNGFENDKNLCRLKRCSSQELGLEEQYWNQKGCDKTGWMGTRRELNGDKLSWRRVCVEGVSVCERESCDMMMRREKREEKRREVSRVFCYVCIYFYPPALYVLFTT